jgi:2'-5' RNA ligase
METIISTIPGYRIFEYLLVLNPHQELRSRIMQVKKEFHESYKTTVGINSKPYVGLVRFTHYQMMEERIVHRLKVIAMSFPPFKVELKDFGSFPSHTIYINVTSKIPVQNLVKEIRGATQRLMKLNDDHKPHFIMEPYLTIARKLLPWQYEKSWLEYSNKHFSGRFIADAMLLLKRPLGEKNYQIAERLEFQNLPVSTKQGDLFF